MLLIIHRSSDQQLICVWTWGWGSLKRNWGSVTWNNRETEQHETLHFPTANTLNSILINFSPLLFCHSYVSQVEFLCYIHSLWIGQKSPSSLRCLLFPQINKKKYLITFFSSVVQIAEVKEWEIRQGSLTNVKAVILVW